jgi:hypothetical protein
LNGAGTYFGLETDLFFPFRLNITGKGGLFDGFLYLIVIFCE